MNSVIVLDQDSNKMNVDVVRYFTKDNNKYLIYTLFEKDESDYVKLYACKLVDEKNAEKIEDENEWTNFKELIKVIVRENKDANLTSVEDLNLAYLTNVKINSYRLFKLAEPIVNLLGANKKEFETVVESKVTTLEELLGGRNDFNGNVEVQPQAEEPKVENTFDVLPQVEEKPAFEQPMVETQPEVAQPITKEQPVVQPKVEEPKVENTFEELPKVEEKPTYAPVYEETFVAPVYEETHFEPAYDEEPNVEEAEPTYEEFPAINYEQLYMETRQKNEQLQKELDAYKEKLEKIKELV